MITLKENCALAISATAPFYSLVVTVPLMYDLVGAMTPIVYLISVVPIIFTNYSMHHNNLHNPNNGAVYSWLQSNKTIAWIAGFSVIVTDIVSTSSQAVVSGEYVLKLAGNINSPILISIVSCLFVFLIALLNMNSLKKTGLVQIFGIIIQIIAMIYVVYLIFTTGTSINITYVSYPIENYAHAILLGIFAYWGFDVVYFVSEESDGSTNRSSLVSIFTLAIFFTSASWIMISSEFNIGHNLFIVFSVFVSAFMSLGSAIIPTANSMVAMSKNKEFPLCLSIRKNAVLAVVIVSSLWIILSVFSVGFFESTVDCLGVFVGAYFSSSLYAAYKQYRGNRFINAFGLILMLSIVALSLWEVIDDVSTGFLTSLAVPFLIIMSIGVIFYYFFFHQKNIRNDQTTSV